MRPNDSSESKSRNLRLRQYLGSVTEKTPKEGASVYPQGAFRADGLKLFPL
jgi:hypothetical protein